jgi:phenylalanyl-tRNA synthetase beta chain
MIISYKLLKDSFGTIYSPKELSEKLTSIGIEVEGIRETKHNFSNIKTGKVISIELVPGTKLFKTIVNIGHDNLQIITAATNLRINDIVPVALPESILANSVAIKKKTFEGLESNGMLCSYLELGLDPEYLSNEEKEGIFTLPDDTTIGARFEEVLPVDDTILELSLLPDRADAFSVNGLARWIEILEARDKTRRADFSKFMPEVSLKFHGETNFEIIIENPEMCPFYSGRFIKEVTVKKSSLKLRQKLFMLKVRPINNLVDITNFVNKFYGQPLHVFDFDKLNERIIIRTARKEEKIKTLDEVERTLTADNLLIADSKYPIAIAGVMGGESTSVTEKTKNIFLESAFFSPNAIAKSSRTLGLITDASTLFEKGIDSKFTPIASLIATKLICEESGGTPFRDNAVSYLTKSNPVKVRFDRINSLLGEPINREEVKKYFDFEGLQYADKGPFIEVDPPSFRQDLKIEEDLIEEVIRMKGYNEFKETLLTGAFKSSQRTEFEEFIWFLKEKLISLGLTEIQTTTLINPDKLKALGVYKEDETIKLLNPLTEDMNILRPLLFPTMLDVLKRNINTQKENISMFEIGKIFKNGIAFEESTELGIILFGDRVKKNAFKKTFTYDFFYLKGLVEEFLDSAKIKYRFEEHILPFMHPYQCIKIIASKKEIGYLGKIKDEIFKNVFFASILVDGLFNKSYKLKNFEDFSIYPPVKRDIAIIVDEHIPEKKVRETIINLDFDELKSITLFDIYKGPPLPEGKKNLAYSLEFSSMDKTLKGEEIDKLIEKIEKEINTKIGGMLRKK